MFTVKHLISRIGLAFIAGALAFNLSIAHAIPFTSDLSITGDTTFDDGFSFGGSGDFDVVEGGVTTQSTYSDSTVTGSNPLLGTLTDINDGIGFTGVASAAGNDLGPGEFAIGFDTYLNLTNNSATDAYEVVFKLNFSNTVNADGADGVSDSELTLDADGSEIFFSDLISDTLNGDEDGGNLTGGFGDPLSDSGDAFFTFLLNPTDMLDLDMAWTLTGGDFAQGLAEADLSAFLSVYSVTLQGGPPVPTPLPATFFLVGLGLILLPLQRRMRTLMGK